MSYRAGGTPRVTQSGVKGVGDTRLLGRDEQADEVLCTNSKGWNLGEGLEGWDIGWALDGGWGMDLVMHLPGHYYGLH